MNTRRSARPAQSRKLLAILAAFGVKEELANYQRTRHRRVRWHADHEYMVAAASGDLTKIERLTRELKQDLAQARIGDVRALALLAAQGLALVTKRRRAVELDGLVAIADRSLSSPVLPRPVAHRALTLSTLTAAPPVLRAQIRAGAAAAA